MCNTMKGACHTETIVTGRYSAFMMLYISIEYTTKYDYSWEQCVYVYVQMKKKKSFERGYLPYNDRFSLRTYNEKILYQLCLYPESL